MIALLLFLLGLTIGSFINAAVYRIQNGRPVINGRSFCPHCKHKLSWKELFPVFSFIILRAKCFHCRKPISFIYPATELLTGLSFAVLVYVRPDFAYNPLLLALNLLIISFLIFIALYDFKYFLILDVAVFIGVVVSLGLSYYANNIKTDLISAFILTVFFAGLYMLSKGGWIGFGDVKFALFLGLVNGPLVFFTLLTASWLGSIIGLLMIFLKRGTLKSQLPFGTLLAVSSVSVLIFEEQIYKFLELWLY